MSADAVSASFQADAEWLVAALERYRTESESKAAPVTLVVSSCRVESSPTMGSSE